jgi:hypothetical protein
MAKLDFTRTQVGLIPANEEAAEWVNRVKLGQPVNVTVTVPRNGGFHRKYFEMLRVAYDNHEWPEIETQYGMARCSFDMFRDYVTVRAGYYKPELTPTGKVRVTPKSISFAKMEQDEFEKLYSDTLDVILAEFLTNWSTGDMENAVNQMMQFA